LFNISETENKIVYLLNLIVLKIYGAMEVESHTFLHLILDGVEATFIFQEKRLVPFEKEVRLSVKPVWMQYQKKKFLQIPGIEHWLSSPQLVT
jgi:hypothetical protein